MWKLFKALGRTAKLASGYTMVEWMPPGWSVPIVMPYNVWYQLQYQSREETSHDPIRGQVQPQVPAMRSSDV